MRSRGRELRESAKRGWARSRGRRGEDPGKELGTGHEPGEGKGAAVEGEELEQGGSEQVWMRDETSQVEAFCTHSETLYAFLCSVRITTGTRTISQ